MFKKRTLISSADYGSGTMKDTKRDSSKLSASAVAVVSSDDILTEILLRLPVITLLLFKSVSKRWFSLITDPIFTLRLMKNPNVDPPSGLFLWRQQRKTFSGYDFVPLDARIPAYRYPSFNAFNSGLLEGNIQLLHSCNGLLLLCVGRHELHVYNPSMNLVKKLPEFPEPPDAKFESDGRVIAFDPTKSPHYKVVNAGVLYGNGFDYSQIRVYSSETGNWNVNAGRFCVHILRSGFEHGIYVNGSIHWLTKMFGRCLLFKLKLGPLAFETMRTPDQGKVQCDHKLFGSCGCLVLACMECSPPHDLNVYTMNSEYSGWSLKYTVKLDDILWMFPKTKRPCRRVCYDVRCIMVAESEDDSFLVIERNGMVLRYKLASKTLHHLHDLGSKVRTDSFKNFQFTASFAGV